MARSSIRAPQASKPPTVGCTAHQAKPPVCGPSGKPPREERSRRRELTDCRAVRTAFQRSTGEQRAGSFSTLRSSSSTAASTLPRCSSMRPHACGGAPECKVGYGRVFLCVAAPESAPGALADQQSHT